MDKVYYWKPDAKGNIGHASLDISFGEGPGRAEYVSWWPGTLSFVKPGVPSTQFSYADDRDAEGAEATAALGLYCLDADKMRQEWYRIKKTEGYAFYTINCASVVQRLLIAGGGALSLSVTKFLATMPIVATPWNVFGLAQVISANSDVIVKQRKAGWVTEKPGWFDDWGTSGPGTSNDGLIR